MKKLLFLLLALPLLMVSCDDDDNFPKVQLKIDGSGGVTHEGYIYLLQGDTLSIDSIGIVSAESTSGVKITGANYYLDYRPVWSTVVAPFGYKLETGTLATGSHILEIQCPVLAVGYSPAVAFVSYQLRIVDSEDDMPSSSDSTSVSGSFLSEIKG